MLDEVRVCGPHDRISALACSTFSPCEDRRWPLESFTRETALARNRIGQHIDPGLLATGTVRNSVVHRILLWQPK